MEQTRIGILGTSRLSAFVLGTPLEAARVTAVASRDAARASAFAREFSLEKAYASYGDLLNDPDIDAVYIPLPNHLHCEYAIAAARAGKHVLLEKPAALSVAEITRMEAACREAGVVSMEALMYRFKTIHRKTLDLVKGGAIGRVRYVDFNWCFNIRALSRSSIRLDPAAGGGALNDLGIYGVDFIRLVGGTEARLLEAHMRTDPQTGVDLLTHATFLAGETMATLTCGFTTDANYYVVSGELGSLYVPGSVSGRMVENTMSVHVLEGDKRTEERFPVENPYRKEMEYFARCVQHHTQPETGLENSLRNITLLEEIRRTGRPF